MTSPPDKLFRQGLEHFQKPAPGSAWERIESGLGGKRNRSPWMKIAAGLLFVIVTSVVVLQFNPIDSSIAAVSTVSSEQLEVSSSERSVDPAKFNEFAAGQQSTVDSLKSLHSNPIVERSRNNSTDLLWEDLPVVERSRNEPSRNSLQSAVPSPQSTVYSPQSSVAIQTSVTPDESHLTATTEPVETSIEYTPMTQVKITNEISPQNVASNSKRTNITYTAEEVNAKYLKKESPAEATPEKKNTSGLQKVIDLALDLKNEGSVLGDIREKKNEWLSLNMPSNKRETNK